MPSPSFPALPRRASMGRPGRDGGAHAPRAQARQPYDEYREHITMTFDSKSVAPTRSPRTVVVAAAVLLIAFSPAAHAQGSDRWVGTWTASPVAPFGEPSPANLRDSQFQDQTV